MDVSQLQNEIQFASMLIDLGVTTVNKIEAFFKAKGVDDDVVLAQIMSDVDSRLARREPPPPPPAA